MNVTRRTTASLVVMLLVLGSCFASSACDPAGAPAAAAPRSRAPQWQDVFEGVPDLYAVIRPQAIKRDAVFGPLWKALLRVAHARTSMHGATTLEALEGCDEIILGIRKDVAREDAAIVFRGVPAHLDAEKMTDEAGLPIFRASSAPDAVVQEYDWAQAPKGERGTVFVLPDRTWVGVLGEERARARRAFAARRGIAALAVEPRALAVVRFDADAFARSSRITNSKIFGPLAERLRALTVALMPGKGGVVATLQYDVDDASVRAEAHTRRLLALLATKENEHSAHGAEEGAKQKPPAEGQADGGEASVGTSRSRASKLDLGWLERAAVRREGRDVSVAVDVPPRLLHELPSATARDLLL